MFEGFELDKTRFVEFGGWTGDRSIKQRRREPCRAIFLGGDHQWKRTCGKLCRTHAIFHQCRFPLYSRDDYAGRE